MNIAEREINNYIILNISGDIDLYNSHILADSIQKCIDSEHYHIILNFQKVVHDESSGLGAMLHCMTQIKRKKGVIK